jgi:hypothetical protein
VSEIACKHGRLARQCNECFLESELTAAQAEIAELKELIKREVVPDIKDAEIARLQSALDVAVEFIESISTRELDSQNIIKRIYILDKIKQIRGEK